MKVQEKVSKALANAVHHVSRGGYLDVMDPLRDKAWKLGFITIDRWGDERVTDEGRKVAEEFARKKDAARAKSRAAARARRDAMTGLGLTRTRDGRWE